MPSPGNHLFSRARCGCGGGVGSRVHVLVPGAQVPVQVPASHEPLGAEGAPVWRVPLGVQAHVLVQVGRVAEGPPAEGTLQGLVARVRAHVDLQPVPARMRRV